MLNYFFRFRYTVIIDDTNSMAVSENSLLWVYRVYFLENDVFDGPAYVIHWDLAMHNDLFKNIVLAYSLKINLDRN